MEDVVVILLQMLEKMQKYRFRSVAFKNVAVTGLLTAGGIKNMAEQFLAQLLQQGVLGFKMRIKGCPAHICPFYDLTNSDAIVVPAGKQVGKGGKNCFSGFSLASVHKVPHTIW